MHANRAHTALCCSLLITIRSHFRQQLVLLATHVVNVVVQWITLAFEQAVLLRVRCVLLTELLALSIEFGVIAAQLVGLLAHAAQFGVEFGDLGLHLAFYGVQLVVLFRQLAFGGSQLGLKKGIYVYIECIMTIWAFGVSFRVKQVNCWTILVLVKPNLWKSPKNRLKSLTKGQTSLLFCLKVICWNIY